VGRAAPAAFVGECGQRRWLQVAVASCRNHGCGSGGSLHSSHLTRTRSASTRRSAAGSCRVGARSHGKRASSDFRLLTREREHGAHPRSEKKPWAAAEAEAGSRGTRACESCLIWDYYSNHNRGFLAWIHTQLHFHPVGLGSYFPVTFYFNFFSVANLAHVRIIA